MKANKGGTNIKIKMDYKGYKALGRLVKKYEKKGD